MNVNDYTKYIVRAADVLPAIAQEILNVADAAAEAVDRIAEALEDWVEEVTEPAPVSLSLEEKWAAVKATGRNTQTVSIIDSLINHDGHTKFGNHINALYKYHVLENAQ